MSTGNFGYVLIMILICFIQYNNIAFLIYESKWNPLYYKHEFIIVFAVNVFSL